VIFEALSAAERAVCCGIGCNLGQSPNVFSEPSTRRAEGPPRSARRWASVSRALSSVLERRGRQKVCSRLFFSRWLSKEIPSPLWSLCDPCVDHSWWAEAGQSSRALKAPEDTSGHWATAPSTRWRRGDGTALRRRRDGTALRTRWRRRDGTAPTHGRCPSPAGRAGGGGVRRAPSVPVCRRLPPL